MASSFCIPVVMAEKLKKAAQDGEINIAKMYEMSSAERRGLFERFVDKSTAKEINTGFENAMISEQQTALKKWAQNTFVGGEKAQARQKDVFAKIDELKNQGVLTPEAEKSFLQDLVAEKLGITVTPEEGKQIADRAAKIEELQSKLTKIGDPTENPQGQLDYFKAKREMENYLDSLTPSSKLKVITSTISRGNMLFRLGSILVNINSNNIEGVMGGIVRRLDEKAITGANTKHIGDLMKFYLKVYKETGYDLTRMQSLESDRKVLGEGMVHSQGKGLIRKIGRFYEDKVFGLTQGTPDVVAAALAAGDRGNLLSTKLAYREGLKGKEAQKRALEIFKDASLVEPQTKVGQQVKQAMIADAERSTNTDKRFLAERALKLRNLLNVGDLRFGDLNVPFVKTTANSIQSGLQASGVTIPIEVPIRLIKMVKLVQDGGSTWGEAKEEAFRGFSDTVVRAGIGFLASWLIAHAIKKEDYIGVYPTNQAEQQLLKIKTATPNSIRIGDKWVSLDWFGPLAAPIIGHLNAKKYEGNIGDYAYHYLTGAGYQVLRTPGLDYLAQSLTSLKNVLSESTKNTPANTIKDIGNYLVDFSGSRAIPGFVSDIAQLTDNVVRDTSRRNDILAPIKNKIPGNLFGVGRQSLPEARTVFGETIPTEGWKTLIFGSRVKTVTDSPLISELTRLNQTGNLPSITDVAKTSPRASALREQIGDDRFNEAMQLFGSKFKEKSEHLIQTRDYKKLSDEKKAAAINNIKNDLFDKVLKKYGYKKPKN